jgi:hypothetical protein
MRYGQFKECVTDDKLTGRAFPLTNNFTQNCCRGGFRSSSGFDTSLNKERVCKNQLDWMMKRI